MSRKTILIILAVIIVALGVWVYVESQKSISMGGQTSQKGILGSLFPFGSNSQKPATGGDTAVTPSGGSTDTTPVPATPGRLTEMVKDPTAGFVPIVPLPPVATASTIVYPKVRYAESGTGYIYDIDAKGQNAKKVSATVIARAAQAFFGDNGASVILRYIGTDNQTISTYLAHFTPSVDALMAGSLMGSFLADNISDLALSPDGHSFAYLLPAPDGSVATTEKMDGTSKKQVFSSPFSEWLLDWSSAGITVTTKAASTVPGYAYIAGTNGSMVKVAGEIDGLTTKMSPDGKNLLYSVSTANGLELHVKRLKDASDMNTGLATLPEKCVWTKDSASVYCGVSATLPSGIYPDSWYQGSAHFSDAFWQILATTGTTTEVDDGEGKSLDAIELALDAKNSFLFFINKTDGTLWSLDLSATPAVQ